MRTTISRVLAVIRLPLVILALIASIWLTVHQFLLGVGALVLALTFLWITRRNITAGRLVISGGILLLVGIAEGSMIYPVRVSFSFDYRGKHFETSYVTTVIMHLSDPFFSVFRWDANRRLSSLPLPDGSLVLLTPDWPYQWQTFVSGAAYQSRGRWFWLDNAADPQLIVYGDAATRRSASRAGAAPFAWIEVSATIERVSEFFLPQALESDANHDAAERLVFSSLNGGSQTPSGALFQEVALTVLIDQRRPEDVQAFLNEPGWVDVPGNCRIRDIASGQPLFKLHSERIGLLREADTWRADGGPLPGEPAVMYSTGTSVVGIPWGAGAGKPLIGMVHAVEWEGQTCHGIELSGDAVLKLIQFPDGRLAVLSGSPEMAILKEQALLP